METNEFLEYVKKLNVEVTEEKLKKLEEYFQILILWNNKMNLTSITEKKDVYLKHFYDSLTITKIVDLKQEESLCDIGTGAGFPGIVLKIFFPHLKVTLIESLQKRVIFLNEVIQKLKLKDIVVINERAEDYAKKTRESFDVVTSRAVANIYILLEYSVHLVKIHKYFIPMKGKLEELKDITKVSKELNIQLVDKQEFYLPIEESMRNLLKFEKLGKTNSKYPRKYNEIKKKPLC